MNNIKRGHCNWPGCTEITYLWVDGIDFCREHVEEQLKKIVLEGLPAFQLDDQGKPMDRRWLNKFARLAADSGGPSGLTKGKVETRSFGFQIVGTTVQFQIERHPVGRVEIQKWSYDVGSDTWKHLETKTVKSNYAWSKEAERYICPACGGRLDVTPGRARCGNCEFEDLHEHSE